jgi:hypothetical protein
MSDPFEIKQNLCGESLLRLAFNAEQQLWRPHYEAKPGEEIFWVDLEDLPAGNILPQTHNYIERAVKRHNADVEHASKPEFCPFAPTMRERSQSSAVWI